MSAKPPHGSRVPPHIARLKPYVPGKPIEEVERELGITALKLASNENPLGPSPKALEAIRHAASGVHRYPDAAGYYVRRKLAERHAIEMEQIVLGAGSTELIQLLAHIYLGPGDVGASSDGSFVVFPLSVEFTGAEAQLVPLRDYAYDLDGLAAALDMRTRLVYVANPNNPTGTMFTAAALDRFLERIPESVLVIVDEAYYDYVGQPDYTHAFDYVRAGRNVIVLRTFSKVHGLAGLRIGYGVAHREIIGALDRVRSPFNVSTLAHVAALAALDDPEHIERSLAMNRMGLKLLATELPKLGCRVVPSYANFLYVETGYEAKADAQALLQEGVIVRPLGFMGMPQGLRVTVGTPSENQRLLEAFAKLQAQPEAARLRPAVQPR